MSYTWRLAPDTRPLTSSQRPVNELQAQDTLIGLRDPVININRDVFASTTSDTYELILAGQ